MKTRSSLFWVAALVAAGLLGCGQATSLQGKGDLPGTELSDLAGGSVALASLPDEKPLLVWFWAPW